MCKWVSATGKTVGEIQALACELLIKGPKHKIKKKQTNTQVKESINKLEGKKERKGGTKGRRELISDPDGHYLGQVITLT